MALLDAPAGVALMWGVAFLSALALLVPPVMFLLRGPRVRVEVIDDPNAVEPRGADPGYRSALAAFSQMGFRRVGRIVESAWFFSPLRWHWRSQGSTWLVAKDGKTFVNVFKPRGRDRWMTSAMTLFSGGGYVDTISSKAGLQVLSGDQWRVELGDVEPAELIAEHQRSVDDFGRERGVAVKAASFREMVGVMNAFQQSVLPRRRVASLLLIAIFLAVASLPLLSTHGKIGRHAPPQPLMVCFVAALVVFLWVFRRVPSRSLGTVRVAVVVVDLLIVLIALWHRSHRGPLATARAGIEADVRAVRSLRDVDRIVRYGPRGCLAVLKRYDDPQATPEVRRVLHTILVRWNGTDLGENGDGWRPWCETVGGAPGP